MSPASQGVLEVERYIGSCLISSNVRGGLHGKFVVSRKQEPATTTTTTTVVRGGKTSRGCYNNGGGQSYPGLAEHQQYGGPGGWTGAPLISMMSSPRRCNQRSSPSLNQQQQQTCDQQQVVPGGPHKNPLSRLAIHTQGAPLILAGRFYNRGKVHGGNPPSNYIHSNGNGPTRFATSRIASQRPADAKKPPPTMVSANSKTTDCSPATTKENVGSSNIANIDSLSIASDESSGSNNSENSLPRIIKPRKRRKKDRKPPNNVVAGSVEVKSEESQRQQQQQQQPAGCGATIGEQSNVAGARSYAPTCYEARIYEAAVPHLRNYRRPPVGHRDNNYGACRTPSMQAEMADVRQQRYVHHRHHVQVKVLDDNRNVIAAPMRVATPLKSYRHHHDNADCNLPRRFVHEYPGESCEEAARRDGPGPCQCRYCDPAGLIWEVDRNGCYSSFLTTATTTTTTTTTTLPPPPPPVSSSEYRRNHFGQMPLFLTSPTLDERAFDDDAGSAEPGGVALRRSWSDPTSYFSYGEEIVAPTRDVGVIGDRGGQFESGNHKRTLWRGDSIGGASTSSPANANGGSAAGGSAGSPKGLEVSTEIVTSPNGHRDLEIKFYSSSSSSSPAEHLAEEDKSSSLTGEPDDDDNGDDDLSDIWSYHELKLQQDFRTLLQAEE